MRYVKTCIYLSLIVVALFAKLFLMSIQHLQTALKSSEVEV